MEGNRKFSLSINIYTKCPLRAQSSFGIWRTRTWGGWGIKTDFPWSQIWCVRKIPPPPHPTKPNKTTKNHPKGIIYTYTKWDFMYYFGVLFGL